MEICGVGLENVKEKKKSRAREGVELGRDDCEASGTCMMVGNGGKIILHVPLTFNYSATSQLVRVQQFLPFPFIILLNIHY